MAIRVLIADQETLFRAGLRMLLEKQGFIVVGEASDGIEAIEVAARMQPDVAVLDQFLPGRNVFESARLILDRSPHSRNIVLTDSEDACYLDAESARVISGWLQKNDSFDLLSRTIRDVASGALYLSNATFSRRGLLLSNRENQVLALLAQGEHMQDIADHLGLSIKTIEGHRASLMAKLRLRDIAALARYAIRQGIVEA